MLKLPIKCKVILPYEQLGLEPKRIILKEMLIDLIKIWITQFGSKGAQWHLREVRRPNEGMRLFTHKSFF